MEKFGDFLRREREYRGISIEQVFRETKINPSLLLAIEREDWERIPCRTYMRGHLRALALFVGLDPDDLGLRYEQALSDHMMRLQDEAESAGATRLNKNGLWERINDAIRLSKVAGF